MTHKSYVITAHLEQVAKYYKDLKVTNIEYLEGRNKEPLLKLEYEWNDEEED